jgi:hypothetical protein
MAARQTGGGRAVPAPRIWQFCQKSVSSKDSINSIGTMSRSKIWQTHFYEIKARYERTRECIQKYMTEVREYRNADIRENEAAKGFGVI